MFHRLKRLSLRIKTIAVYVTVGYVVCLLATVILQDWQSDKNLMFGMEEKSHFPDHKQGMHTGLRSRAQLTGLRAEEAVKRMSQGHRLWVPGMEKYFSRKQPRPLQELESQNVLSKTAMSQLQRTRQSGPLGLLRKVQFYRPNETDFKRRQKVRTHHLEAHPVIRQYLQEESLSDSDIQDDLPFVPSHNDGRLQRNGISLGIPDTSPVSKIQGSHGVSDKELRDMPRQPESAYVSRINPSPRDLISQKDHLSKLTSHRHSNIPESNKLETFTVYQFDDSDVAVNTLAKPQLVRRNRAGGGKRPGRRRSFLTPPVVTNLDGNAVTGHMIVQQQ